MIRAGTVAELRRDSGDWLFVDIGFSGTSPSCGMLAGDGPPTALRFSALQAHVLQASRASRQPLNLLIEAPLSVAFNAEGNPVGRTVERRGVEHRYWYVGLGATILLAATYLLRSVLEGGPTRDIRLFEGFVSFKPKGIRSSHAADVVELREVVWRPEAHPTAIVAPEQLALERSHSLRSAFKVSGMDFGIPPVVNVIGG